MPRRTDRKQLNAVLSEAQHAALLTLAGSEAVNDYIRRLISEDAARRGIVWPDDLPGPGKYPRPGQVINKAGISLNFESAVTLMADDLCEELHMQIAPCSDQEFFTAYEEAHAVKFGEPWELSKQNPTW